MLEVNLFGRSPDFKGSYGGECPCSLYGEPGFSLYVVEEKDLGQGCREIEGILTDCMGRADFHGFETPGGLRFKIQYGAEALKKGATPNVLEFCGALHGNEYSGTYTEHGGMETPGTGGPRQYQFSVRGEKKAPVG